MSGLFQPLFIAGLSSFAAAFLAALLASIMDRADARSGVVTWRTARWLAIAPVLLAPAIYVTPGVAPPLAGNEFGMPLGFEPLPHAESQTSPIADGALPSGPAINLPMLIAILYLAGVCVSAARFAARRILTARLVAECRALTGVEQVAIKTMAATTGAVLPDIRVTTKNMTPVLTGWNSVILLPEEMLSDLQSIRYALIHELVHHRRGDERDRLIGDALSVLFWFNLPLVWIERSLTHAREIACDAESLEALGGAERKPYAATLIGMMRSTVATASAFGPDNRRHREMRIRAILAGSGRRAAPKTVLIATLMASFVPVACGQAVMTERLVVLDDPASNMLRGGAEDGNFHRNVTRGGDVANLHEDPSSNLNTDVSANIHVDHDHEHLDEEHNIEIGEPHPEPDVHVGGRAISLTHRVAEGRISSRYGPRPARPAGSDLFHYGVDISAPAGTPIHAPAGGTIVHAAMGYNGSDAWGYTVSIDHGDGWQSVYAHMQNFNVEVGDFVDAGQTIGRVGSTGRSTGPHVHVELHQDGVRIDPAGHFPGID